MFDRISGLPDEILVSILSLLSLKEAQATSILSRRWHYVWAFSTTLNFDAEQRLIRFCKPKSDRERELGLCMYVDWVDSVLNQHRVANIERFRIAFELGPRSCIDKWIQFAMRKGVQILELDLSAILYPWGLQYKFSNQVLGISEFSSFKALCSEYIGFKFLKVLDFNRVDVDQDILEYFIYNCPVLERVAVCDSSLMVNLRVVGQSIALKYLTIQQCLNLKSIEICEANLISFTYGGDLEKLLLRNLPLLVEISLSGMTRITGWSAKIDFSYLSCCLSQLEILKINYIILWGETDPVIPSLPNLKCLELAFDEDNNYALLHIAFFIKQTPCLHTLVMKFRSWRCPKNPFAKKRAARYSHDCLKVVKFLEYSGLSRQIELVKYLMKTASNLEKIIFDPVNRQYSGVHRLLFPHIVEMEELSRAEAHQLKEKLPATLDVVCQ
uniref:F-box/LRR-repeat protein At3g58900-like isoform X2 n=1 Tax=Fragaria vesca subsp. vesca TaxID=101020 RepID=UPI0005C875BD|nr:PREDICTED: F-box/LRR-repeat protein At3g58900-like isoform X2 [Fragaria vesca subsp. vesca]